MSLTFLLGGAGSGKSALLRNRLIESSLNEPDLRHVILVPEQFTMQTQRDILAAHPRHAAVNIEVLSFERLAYRVIPARSSERFTVLTEMGKQMLLRRAAEDSGRELTVFAGSIRRPGFLRSLSEMLSEFYQYDSGDLLEIADRLYDQPLLKRKLSDLGRIRKSFEARRENGKITAEELLPGLLRLLPASDLMSGCRLYIDSFTGFTPVQLAILDILMSQTSHMEIALLLPEAEAAEQELRPTDLFYMGKSTEAELIRTAEEKEIPWERILLHGDVRHADAPELRFLTEHFMRFGWKAVFAGDCSGIRVTRLRNEAAEAAFAACTIARLVREEGYRYHEIAVVTGDTETYRKYLTTEFARAGIPFFCDSRKGLAGDPLAEFLLSALEIISTDFSYESVMRFVRCGIGPLDDAQADLLDTYLYVTGIRGKSAYQKPFSWCPEKFLEERMGEIDTARETIAAALADLTGLTGRGGYAGAEWIVALRNMMSRADASARLQSLAEAASEDGDSERAEEYRRVFEYIGQILTEAETLFPEERFSADSFLKLLEAGIAEGKLGMLPSGMDQVQIGDIRRSRQNEIRALILLGMNDGLIPSPGASGGILSENERSLLLARGVRLAPAAFDMACQERAYLYMLLCRPKEQLYITFHTQNGSGSAVRPSYLLQQIVSLYEDLHVQTDEDREMAARITGMASLKLAFADGVGRKTEEAEKDSPDSGFDALAAVLQKTDSEAFEKILAAAFPTAAESSILPAAAGLLYGKDIRLSVTRMEAFAECAAAHFLRYGLKLRERKPFTVDQMDRGTFFHTVMDNFFALLKEEGIQMDELTEEDRERLVEAAVSLAKRDEKISRMEAESAEGAYRTGRFTALLDRGIRAVCDLMRRGDFRQEASEMLFSGYNDPELVIRAENGSRMILEGRIDRVDVSEEDGKRYIRVVDYKTGEKILDLNSIYNGLSMQLVLYMAAAMLKDEKRHPGSTAVPAGMYYFSFAEKLADTEAGASEDDIYKKWIKNWYLKGLSASDDLIAAKSEPVSGKKADAAQIRQLIAYTEKKMQETGNRIASGDVEAAPVMEKNRTACDYCPYSAACGFDRKNPVYGYRRMAKMEDKEIWERLKEEAADGGQVDG